MSPDPNVTPQPGGPQTTDASSEVPTGRARRSVSVEEVGGGLDPAGLAEAFRVVTPKLPLADRPAALRFVQAAVSYLRLWHKSQIEAGEQPAGIAAFVASPDLHADARERSLEQILVFRSDKRRQLAGFCHLGSASLNTVGRVSSAATTISEAAADINAAGWAGRTAVIADLAAHEAWLCYDGVAAEDRFDADENFIPADYAQPQEELHLAAVKSFLKRFHEKYLLTPHDGVPIWLNRDDCVPQRYAEKIIQNQLELLATFTFENTRVVPEVIMRGGRADIAFIPLDGLIGESTVLELKVLRSKHSPKDRAAAQGSTAKAYPPFRNRKGLEKGLRQAFRYKDEFRMQHALLCAYDMRLSDEGDGIVASFQTMTETLGVEMMRYYIYRSSDDSRTAQVNAILERRSLNRDGAN